MATINGNYVFVENEDMSRSSTIPQHPVEQGLPITDNVREQPKTISISGKIVANGDKKADTIISELEKLRTSGSLIKYVGRNVVGNYMIRSFSTSHPNTVWGGAEFSMELVEVRIAKSAYDPTKQKQKVTPTIEVGALVVFKGGAVYVSSDATKAAANRDRQTCKITKISRKSWSIHQIHLISTEKVYPYNVYGWVDEFNIEGAGNSSGSNAAGSNATGSNATGTSPTTNAGTQQVTNKTTYKVTNIGEISLYKAGSLTADIWLTETLWSERLYNINGVQYYYDVSNQRYIQTSYAVSKTNPRDSQLTRCFPKNTPYYMVCNKENVTNGIASGLPKAIEGMIYTGILSSMKKVSGVAYRNNLKQVSNKMFFVSAALYYPIEYSYSGTGDFRIFPQGTPYYRKGGTLPDGAYPNI